MWTCSGSLTSLSSSDDVAPDLQNRAGRRRGRQSAAGAIGQLHQPAASLIDRESGKAAVGAGFDLRLEERDRHIRLTRCSCACRLGHHRSVRDFIGSDKSQVCGDVLDPEPTQPTTSWIRAANARRGSGTDQRNLIAQCASSCARGAWRCRRQEIKHQVPGAVEAIQLATLRVYGALPIDRA